MNAGLLRTLLAVLVLALAPALALAQFSADLAITKTDGLATAVPGGTVTYVITVVNGGPDLSIAMVSDTLPAELAGASWTCVPSGGAICTGAGAGNINDLTLLPAGGSLAYTLTATVVPGATGNLSNTATVAATAPTADPNPANNAATDTDVLLPAPGPAPTPIPTLSGYGLVLLALLLAAGGLRARRR